jgi:outer membrane receptor protein involved in Fe transport
MLFARFATGFRPGGPNIAVLGLPPVYKPDTTENFEGGVKSKFWNGKGAIDITGYYTKWNDIIVATGVGGISGAGNAGDARIYGIESTLTLRPAARLTLTGSLAYSNAKLDKIDPAGLGTGAVGDILPNNPRWSGSLVADYRFPIGEGWQGVLGGSARFAGKRHAALQSGFTPDYVMPAYALFDLRGGVTSGRIDIDIFVRNLTDKRAQLGALTQYGLAEVTVQRPRTFGLSMTVHY